MSGQTAFISLGGNLGDPAETIRHSLLILSDLSNLEVQQVSSFYLTKPVGSVAGDSFVNAAAKIETSLSPEDLLENLLEIERKLGRVRSQHWGPRTLDLDLLFYDDQIIHQPNLLVPHPAMWYRRFVLVPLAEIAPEWLHPGKLVSVQELLRMTEVIPYTVHLIGSEADFTLFLAAAREFPQVELKRIDYKADLAGPHSMALFIQPTATISWEDCPLLTSLNLQETPKDRLQQTITDLFTAALGEVIQYEADEA
ncbi:MAG: 2-amino-4-hydroxy-6-hydroxymethyldihydropteridine diphosphokinase [Planctomycetaceae bacterium]|nr:2-amino-4-hydroxy-6-hydroxymethyldihydropteridine diphosphokinase [Planctomycetaceae bacterium]